MKISNVVGQVQHEAKLAQGDEVKDVIYSSQNTFSDEQAAEEAFAHSVTKLLNVNGWSDLSLFASDFALHDPAGQLKPGGSAQMGDYIAITLPGPMPKNWVQIIHLDVQKNRAEFTVQPSHDPTKNKPDETAHFFCQEARSTFRVDRSGQTISAFEIGQQERINNEGPQAGERAIINTVIAEAGWLFYQKIQWKLLTDYLVHL